MDENAHRHYNPVDELLTDYGGKMVYIRFNPDPTPEDNSDLEDRLKPLIGEIYKQMGRITREENTDLVEIFYMFYPSVSKHANSSNGPLNASFNCTTCNRPFANKYNLAKHMRHVHREVDSEENEPQSYDCISKSCKYQTLYRGDHKRHIAKCGFVLSDQTAQTRLQESKHDYDAKVQDARETIIKQQVEIEMLRQQLDKAYEEIEKYRTRLDRMMEMVFDKSSK